MHFQLILKHVVHMQLTVKLLNEKDILQLLV